MIPIPVSSLSTIQVCVFLMFSQKPVHSYQWLEYNDRFDCVVGIMLYDTPVSIGTFITETTVITSANPLQKYWKDHANHIYIYKIDKTFDQHQYRKAHSIYGNQGYRNLEWVAVGYNDTRHSTIHDIMIITVQFFFNVGNITGITYDERREFEAVLPREKTSFKFHGGWYYAGFGYVDKEHIKNNTVLEISYLEESTLADCDEWIPREWGRFICFYDLDHYAGLPSGAPLFLASDVLNTENRFRYLVLYGIGSFKLTKANETILVFTDLKPYFRKLYGLTSHVFYELEHIS